MPKPPQGHACAEPIQCQEPRQYQHAKYQQKTAQTKPIPYRPGQYEARITPMQRQQQDNAAPSSTSYMPASPKPRPRLVGPDADPVQSHPLPI
ncbi:hypothetical protein BDW60DRAFT_212583 [Aspergillus nidulans var. acristatus]